MRERRYHIKPKEAVEAVAGGVMAGTLASLAAGASSTREAVARALTTVVPFVVIQGVVAGRNMAVRRRGEKRRAD